MSEWISIDDRLPTIEFRILVTDGECVDTAEYYSKSFHSDDSDGESFLYMRNVTHWMPLPEAPNV